MHKGTYNSCTNIAEWVLNRCILLKKRKSLVILNNLKEGIDSGTLDDTMTQGEYAAQLTQ